MAQGVSEAELDHQRDSRTATTPKIIEDLNDMPVSEVKTTHHRPRADRLVLLVDLEVEPCKRESLGDVRSRRAPF